MFTRELRPEEEEVIKEVVALMARSVESASWVWTEKDYAYARRVVEQSFGEGYISRVAMVHGLGVVGWAAAYETTGKLWKTAVLVYDRHYKCENDWTPKRILEAALDGEVESRGGITEEALYRTTRRTELTDNLSRN